MKLKDIFFESDDNDKTPSSSTNKSTPQPPAAYAAEPDSIEPTQIATHTTNTSGVDDFIKLFKNAMKGHSDKGPNYFEFVTALDKMKTHALDDKTKYESIFAGFDVQGVTPAGLIQSARQYQQIFSSKKSEFEAAIGQAVTQNVEAKKQQIQSIKAKNKSIDDQMLSLNEQKLANEDMVKKLTSEIVTASSKIESNKADFNSAFEQANQEIESNIQKITEFLGTSN